MPIDLDTDPNSDLRAGLPRVLDSLDALRNGRALYLLLATFAVAGLLLAMAQSSLSREATAWAALQGGGAFFVAFYGASATGLVLLDQARGRPSRDPADAVRDALLLGHRLLLVLGVALLVAGLLAAAVAALLALARLPLVGPLVFGLAVPLGVLVLGGVALAMAGLVVPLAAPAIWAGLGVGAVLRLLRHQLCHALVPTVLLVAAVSLLGALVAALVSFVLVSGAQALSMLSPLVAGVDLPPQFLAGVFGQGWRTAALLGAPVAANPHGAAALVGGGLVFVLAVALPGLVYLRGLCAVFLALRPHHVFAEANGESSAWTS